MKYFTMENDNNNITVYNSAKEEDAGPDSERFSNETALAALAAKWPAARLVGIWNSLPGVTEVKKFKDGATADLPLVNRVLSRLEPRGTLEEC